MRKYPGCETDLARTRKDDWLDRAAGSRNPAPAKTHRTAWPIVYRRLRPQNDEVRLALERGANGR